MVDPYAAWYEHPTVILDVETTGLGPQDRVIQLGLARFHRGELVDSWSGLIWIGMEVPEGATKIHGITTAMLAGSPPFVAAIPHVARLARGAWPAAYNASFDKRLFFSEMSRLAVRLRDVREVPVFNPDVRWIDPLAHVRNIDRFAKGNKLVQVCQRYGIELENAHDARSDAVAAGKLLWHIRSDIGEMTMTEMLRQQEVLAEAFERKMAAWKARQNPKTP